MELTFLHILLSLCVMVGIFLTNKFGAKISARRLNFATWYYLVEFILMSVISVFSIRSIADWHWALRFIPKELFPIKPIIFSLSWCAIALPLGFWLANLSLQKLKFKTNIESFYESKIISFINENKFYAAWAILISLYTAYVVYKIGFIPQLKSIDMTLQEKAMLRGQLTHHFPASIHLKELLGMHLAPILCFARFSQFINHKNLKNFMTFILFLLLATFFSSLNLSKSGLLYIIIGLIFSYSISSSIPRIKYLLISGFLLITLLISSYLFLTNSKNLKESVTNAFNRTVYLQTVGNYISFYIFPEKHPHIGFASISKLQEKVGLKYSEPASRIMMKIVTPEHVKDGTAGYMVSTFFAEAWANWGILGVLISPILVGFIIKLLVGLTISFPKFSITIGFLSFISFRLGLNLGINQFLFPRYIIVSVILLIVSFKLAQKKSMANSFCQ